MAPNADDFRKVLSKANPKNDKGPMLHLGTTSIVGVEQQTRFLSLALSRKDGKKAEKNYPPKIPPSYNEMEAGIWFKGNIGDLTR